MVNKLKKIYIILLEGTSTDFKSTGALFLSKKGEIA